MIRTVLFANKEVEKRIRATERMERDIGCALSMRYMRLVVNALRLGLTKLAREIVDLSSRLPTYSEQKHRIGVWRALGYLPGWLGSPLALGYCQH